jgi:hypothetical protein
VKRESSLESPSLDELSPGYDVEPVGNSDVGHERGGERLIGLRLSVCPLFKQADRPLLQFCLLEDRSSDCFLLGHSSRVESFLLGRGSRLEGGRGGRAWGRGASKGRGRRRGVIEEGGSVDREGSLRKGRLRLRMSNLEAFPKIGLNELYEP